jgi:hypothetical protein
MDLGIRTEEAKGTHVLEKAENNAEFLYYFIAALLQEMPYEAGEKLLDTVENYLDTITDIKSEGVLACI